MSAPAVPYEPNSQEPVAMAAPNAPLAPPTTVDDALVYERLLEQGYSSGLAQALVATRDVSTITFKWRR